MNGYGHFLPRVRCVPGSTGARRRVLLLVLALLFWSARHGELAGASAWPRRSARLERPDARRRRRRRCWRSSRSAAHLLQHQRPQPLRDDAPTRQALQAEYEKRYKPLRGRAAAEDHRGDAGRRPLPARAAACAMQRHATRSRTSPASRSAGCCWTSRRPRRSSSTSSTLGVPAPARRRTTPSSASALYRLDDAAARRARSTTLAFDLELRDPRLPQRGLEHRRWSTTARFVNGRAVLPHHRLPGRAASSSATSDRKKFGLRAEGAHARPRRSRRAAGERPRSATPTSSTSRRRCRTEPDQIAIAPGYLQREWTEGGRRYFHYKMDAPILNFYAFQSARYAVKKDAGPAGRRRGDRDLLPAGPRVQPRPMIDAVQGLARLLQRRTSARTSTGSSASSSSRATRRFAQSFPNTIPYSEAIGFIARVRPDDPKDIDYPYYVTAHEVAHQWWAHQVIGGDVQGGTMLVETLAQYSALMVMKKKFGAGEDAALPALRARPLPARPRASSRRRSCRCRGSRTRPTSTTSKGSLVMYALQDYIGEDKLNQAIRTFRDAHALQGPALPEQRASWSQRSAR